MLEKVVLEKTRCRICGTALPDENIVDLGDQLVSDFPLPGQPQTRRGPLQLVRCVEEECQLVQLRHTTPRDWHYRGDYWYLSGVNESMVEALGDVVKAAVVFLGGYMATDTWIDIGANDGTLLAQVKGGLQKVAVEPVPQFGGPLEELADLVMPTYWPCRYDGPKAKVITSVAMFYDLDDPQAFVEAIREALHPEGVWVVQYADLRELYENTDLGTICHEHLCYYSLRPVERLLWECGLRVRKVERNQVNGGSVRLFVQHRASGREAEGAALGLHRSADDAFCRPSADGRFREAVDAAVNRFWAAWTTLKVEDSVDIYGASTKGNTLLQTFELGPDRVRQAIERSPAKFGRTTVNGIPIVPEKEGRKDPAGAWIVLPWHFREGIVRRERKYLEQGGKLLFPLPWASIVEAPDV